MVIRSAVRGGGPYNADESVFRQDRERSRKNGVVGSHHEVTRHSGTTDKINIETISKSFSAVRLRVVLKINNTNFK